MHASAATFPLINQCIVFHTLCALECKNLIALHSTASCMRSPDNSPHRTRLTLPTASARLKPLNHALLDVESCFTPIHPFQKKLKMCCHLPSPRTDVSMHKSPTNTLQQTATPSNVTNYYWGLPSNFTTCCWGFRCVMFRCRGCRNGSLRSGVRM